MVFEPPCSSPCARVVRAPPRTWKKPQNGAQNPEKLKTRQDPQTKIRQDPHKIRQDPQKPQILKKGGAHVFLIDI